MKAIVSILPILFFSTSLAQTKIVIQYDEAGNQIYRGPDNNIQSLSKTNTEKEKLVIIEHQNTKEEDIFLTNIELYPIPVKDILTIRWSSEVDDLIDHVSLYEHNLLTNLFTQKNISHLNREIKIDLTPNRTGVYILSFQLKNGKTISKNIIKE
ncbi:T9SS type A sorting domain-containing protein [Riemerella anatipestifer]|uniref:T9SS type A sorting domain-containing protein n=1 Tax=Riemerella anatipestifer TaxID=34085 RepID=UPI0007EDB1C4|nr:T9SS type A sorting domain-containing protein [Riemerella anatipestifer]AZZ59061.1 hypothetical protein AWB57_08510 [Riemerella anatipestifer]MBT0551020.1 hypothetical protein [Riemerella anatipestifer]MBT0553636.1 hypothetical protein [Riemerella anatipestifer]MCE3024025.1 T9SS type A sorting domain-containing protein [Riemerella anatipestifer]MCO7319396.1 T9SS type A sorting domain-containing protein [Riemerella anatipestifer]